MLTHKLALAGWMTYCNVIPKTPMVNKNYCTRWVTKESTQSKLAMKVYEWTFKGFHGKKHGFSW